MELWGGVECTVNRTGDVYRDQTHLSGHQDRIEDLALIAGLGIRALRYPVVWERVAPDHPEERDWRWSDVRLAEIDRLGMRPIAGLLHHGSGPRYTSLVADNFVPLFVDHARAVAERYPNLTDWTPINEPLTTARFSTLYGHWYPHARDDRAFWAAMLNQVDATRGAMKAIRAVNPDARLIQTEDLGHTYATPSLSPDMEHYNLRRWLTWDLLAGRVDREHRFWRQASRLGFEDRLRAIADDPCPPDVIGVNYYPTSERFLDNRAEHHDAPLPADGYHDLTALRVLDPPPPGLGGILRQAWDRYGLPMAVTESHLGCTREEQARWLWQSWRTCLTLRDEGVDIRALTPWALFGSTDWDSLITTDAGHYEPGVFDIRGGSPRPTAIAGVVRLLADGGGEVAPDHPLHPIVHGRGWWQRDIRLEHPPVAWDGGEPAPITEVPTRPILIIGATDDLGHAFAGACRLRGLPHILVDRANLPVADPDRVARALDLYQPWAVIDADDVRVKAEPSRAGNALAAACAARGIHCTVFSSDLEVDDMAPAPDATTLVVRTGAFFSPYDEHNIAAEIERALLAGNIVAASLRSPMMPTYVPDLVGVCLDLAIDREGGSWHLTNQETVSEYDFARRIAYALGLDAALVVSADQDGQEGAELLRSGPSRGAMLPSLHDALSRHAAVRRRARVAAEPALC